MCNSPFAGLLCAFLEKGTFYPTCFGRDLNNHQGREVGPGSMALIADSLQVGGKSGTNDRGLHLDLGFLVMHSLGSTSVILKI